MIVPSSHGILEIHIEIAQEKYVVEIKKVKQRKVILIIQTMKLLEVIL